MTSPVPELPGLIHLVFVDAPGYTTTIANMEDAVMVTDAPAHQSKLVIQCVQENLKKNVTHLLVCSPLMQFYAPFHDGMAEAKDVAYQLSHHHRKFIRSHQSDE